MNLHGLKLSFLTMAVEIGFLVDLDPLKSRPRPRKKGGEKDMDFVGFLLSSSILLGLIARGLMDKAEKPARKFPACRDCGKQMIAVSLPKFMPGEVVNHLDRCNLPTFVASRFICPAGHYQLWYVPRFGNTERAFFMREAL